MIKAIPDGYYHLDQRTAMAAAALWADAGIQQVYANRARFQLIDSAA